MQKVGWPSPEKELVSYVEDERAKILEVYKIKPTLLQEHFNTEEDTLAGGYRYRQVFEVIQNAADAILEGNQPKAEKGRIVVRVVDSKLYVANSGAPLTKDGIVALLGAHSSSKRKNQIGRFGLGFKSLLAFGGKIDLFSRSVSLRFDAHSCQRAIRDKLDLPSDHPTPGLRIAEILSFEGEAASDSQLAELGCWATTILRAEIADTEMQNRVRDELLNFPRQFVLFLPVDVSLELMSTPDETRNIACERLDDHVVLHENDEAEEWFVFERHVSIDDEAALKDAGRLHARNEVPLIWAVPLSGIEEEAGRFWAFFPTDTLSRVPGIINAPWKIDFGRSALNSGDYNKTVMKAAADLVAEHIPKLSDANDPGRVLDAFPRELERKKEPAAPLVETLWDRLCEMAVVPDGHGHLRPAEALYLHPFDDLKLVSQWQESVKFKDAYSKFVHPTCLRHQRIARLRGLRSRLEGELPKPDLCKWFEAACGATASDVKRCLSLVARLSETGNWRNIKEEIRRARIVLSDHGQLVAAKDAVIEGATEDIEGVFPVSPELLSDEEARDVLVNILQISNLDEGEWERRIREAVKNALRQYHNRDNETWRAVWRLLRGAPPSALKKLSNLFDDLRIRCRDGVWRSRHKVLLPGQIVPVQSDDGGPDADLAVDLETHQNDRLIFETIELTEFPRKQLHEFSKENVSHYYDNAMWAAYRLFLKPDQNPQTGKINVVGKFRAPHGWELVENTVGKTQARITQYYLKSGDFEQCSATYYGHTTRPEQYPKIPVINPYIWSLLYRGTVLVAGQQVPVGLIIKHRARLNAMPAHPFDEFEKGLAKLREKIPNGYDLGGDWQEEPFWSAVAAYCREENVSTDQCRAIYEWMAEESRHPNLVRTSAGIVEFKTCYVTQSPALAEAALEAQVPAIALSPMAAAFWIGREAQNLEDAVHLESTQRDDRPVPLVEVVPEFGEVLPETAVEKALVRFVNGLALRVADNTVSKPCVLEAGELWLDRDQMDSLNWHEQMKLLIGEVVNAGWFSGDARDALSQLLAHSVLRLRKNVADGADLPDRLLRAVGAAPERLLDSFDEATRSAIPDALLRDGNRLAELALRIHGPVILARLSDTLRSKGLQPPSRWGTQEARDFVAALGFPPEFAVSPRAKRPPEVTVSGPMPLGQLHDYQSEIIDEVESIVRRRGLDARAVISLPTGAGKTRVAVEATVKHVLTSDTGDKFVLWVAQTDELCEQAVQSFRQVWSNIGRAWTDLRVVRLWGGNPDPAPSPDDVPTAIIASIQTLTSRLGADRLRLLKNCALVVIDESHHAITPSYTRLLNWFLPEERKEDETETRPPVIGLTATPFRGRDEEETQRLASRFDRRMLPGAQRQADLYDQLRKDGILSSVEAEALRHDIPFEFTEEELEHFKRFNELPDSALQRLAGDQSRNDLIVDCVQKAAEEGPVLLFANSVSHAQFLAARLCVLGVSAASIHASTETAVRQYFIRHFQQGEIKVLANYQVLTTGFDAPRTSTIIISRPVFSPVRYMQMVGRGLRGPKNGGTKVCKIITVIDNLRQYANRLAYHYFVKYYLRS